MQEIPQANIRVLFVMARPRNRVYDDKENLAEGLSLHSTSGRFYSIDSRGEREYWGREKSKAIPGYRSRGKRKDYERRLKNVAQGGRKTWRLISESSVTGSSFEDQV